ncbi:hypothetical protein ABFA07_020868 [Porites harrisoni]
MQKKGGILLPQRVVEGITEVTEGEDDEGKPERDAFDALFDNAPEKLNVVKKMWFRRTSSQHSEYFTRCSKSTKI